MKRGVGIVLFLVSLLQYTTAESIDLTRIDSMQEQGFLEQAIRLIESTVPEVRDPVEKAELLWRHSRIVLVLADNRGNNGGTKEELLALYQRGVESADKAIENNPNCFEAYFFKASNLGRWGQTRGIFEALSQADVMRENLVRSLQINPDFGLSWYVLGMLYEQIPGGILSFGNVPFSVSMARKSIDVMKEQIRKGNRENIRYDFYTELAGHLYKRNWPQPLRKRKQAVMRKEYYAHKDVFDKNCYYEGVVDIPHLSDREEAEKILSWVLDSLKRKSDLTKQEREDLDKALSLEAKIF